MTPAEADDLQIRTLLDQLGDPETIAEEAREGLGITRPKAGTPEGIAIALLLVGGLVLPAVGWIIGVVLLWISRVWTLRDKLIGTLVVPGGLALPLFLTAFAVGAGSYCEAVRTPDGAVVETCATQPLQFELWGVPFLVALVLAPIVTAIYLGRRAFAQ